MRANHRSHMIEHVQHGSMYIRERNSQRRQYMFHRWYPMQLWLLAGSQTHYTQHESSIGRRRSNVITHLPCGIAHPRLSRPLPLALWDNAQAYTRHQRDGTRDRNHAHNWYDHRRYHRHTLTRRASHATSHSIPLTASSTHSRPLTTIILRIHFDSSSEG